MEEMINPDTGRDLKGRFGKGNQAHRKHRKPRAITAEVRAYADQENVNIEAVKRLKAIVKNKDGKASVGEQIRASEVLLKHFNITVEKDIDKEIADEGNKTIADMLNDLKSVK